MTFVDKEGEEKHIKVPIGMSMLEAAHENDIELEGSVFLPYLLHLINRASVEERKLTLYFNCSFTSFLLPFSEDRNWSSDAQFPYRNLIWYYKQLDQATV